MKTKDYSRPSESEGGEGGGGSNNNKKQKQKSEENKVTLKKLKKKKNRLQQTPLHIRVKRKVTLDRRVKSKERLL